MSRTVPTLAALILAVLAYVAAPALSARPYVPDAVDFELAAPPAEPSAAGSGRDYVSAPLRAPKRFNTVGLRWRGSADEVHLQVRVRRDGGRWSAWHELPAGAGDGPDARAGEPVREGVSAPAWAGQADWVQYRSERRLTGVRLHFSNTTGTATAGARRATALRRTVSGGVAALAKLPGALVPSARAAEPQPPMVSRSAWGADSQCVPRGAPGYGEVRAAFVHHTVNINEYSREEAPAVVLGICRYHRNSRGWNDIGYNFLVDRYGTIYEGRAGGVDQPVIGAQAQGYNAQSTGIANIGTFDSVPQSEEALNAMAALIRWKLPLHGTPTAGATTLTSAGGSSNRYPAGTPVTIERIAGHRDVDSTACPGDTLYAQLPELRRRTGDVQPAGPPGGVAQTATRLAATPPTTIVYGEPARITGSLQANGGSGVPGEPVELQRQTTSGAFKTIVRGTTAGDGSFALEFLPSKRAVVRVRFPGDDGHGASTSRPAAVQVRPQLTFKRPPARVGLRARGLIRVSGTIAPRKTSVRLIVERRSGRGRKGRIATVRAPAGSGRFNARFRFRSAGLYRLQVVFAGDGKNLPSYGARFHVRATARGARTQAPTGDGGGTSAGRARAGR